MKNKFNSPYGHSVFVGLMILIVITARPVWAEIAPAGAAQSVAINGVNVADPNLGLEAASSYETAGFPGFFQAQTLLWTENQLTRAEMQGYLPAVSDKLGLECRRNLLRTINKEPDNYRALLMAGNYHLYLQQKELALWYYQKAVAVAPQSEEANLALADFFLYQYQSEQARKILDRLSSPEASLRQAAAAYQMSDYQLSLVYLRQAVHLPSSLIPTRIKDLIKTYLALGEFKSAGKLMQPEYFTGSAAPLLWRLKGQVLWSEKNEAAALSIWQKSQTNYGNFQGIAADYWWQYMAGRAKPVKLPDLGNPYLNSPLQLIASLTYWRTGNLNEANQVAAAALKADSQSLLGHLITGRIQLARNNYEEAVKIFERGLAINPGFKPLQDDWRLAKQRLAQSNGSLSDPPGTASKSNVNSARVNGRLVWDETGRLVLELNGALANLAGVWLSADGSDWRYYPWWGAPVVTGRNTKSLWVLPVGQGISGQSLFLKTPERKELTLNKPIQVKTAGISVNLPVAGRLILSAAANEDSFNSSYISPKYQGEHFIPGSFFVGDQKELSAWIRTSNGMRYRLPMSGEIKPYRTGEPFSCRLVAEETRTNQREIRLKIIPVSGRPRIMMMAVGEDGSQLTELNYCSEFSYRLSPSDGLKKIIVKLSDDMGNTTVAEAVVELDTKEPVAKAVSYTEIESGKVRINWGSEEKAASCLQVLTEKGEWRDLPVENNNDLYSGVIDPKQTVFCRIILQDGAGNTGFYSLTALYDKLNFTKEQFLVNKKANSRMITVNPASKDPQLRWQISNDLMVWSKEQAGGPELKWRINTGTGEKLVYIRYKSSPDSQARLLAIPVVTDF